MLNRIHVLYSLKALSILIHHWQPAPASSPLGASRSMQAPRDLFSLNQGCHIIVAVAFGIQWNKIPKADKPPSKPSLSKILLYTSIETWFQTFECLARLCTQPLTRKVPKGRNGTWRNEVAPMAAPKLQSEVTKLQNFVSVKNG